MLQALVSSTMNEWVCSFQQSFVREIHPEETQNHDKTFWTCFRHNLDFNFMTPSFSTVFPSFPAAFCPQYFLFVLVTSVLFVMTYFVVFTIYVLYFHCLLETCCKCCNKQFHLDSILWSNDSFADMPKPYTPSFG